MFDLPDAKRVRRDEVQSPASSRSASPVDESDFQDAHARLGKLLNLDELIGTNMSSENTENIPQPLGADENEDEEQEFEFRLFSAPTKPTPTTETTGETTENKKSTEKSSESGDKAGSGTQKLRIRLRSPTPGSGEGRFVKAFRGWQYYFSTPSLWNEKEDNSEEEADQTEKKRQFEDIAVTGEHMLSWAKSQPWPGCHLPWRITHLKRHQTKMPPKNKDLPVYVVEGAPPCKSPKTRKKPGKKRRVILRKRAAAAQVAKESEAEKRNRKNRERKIKRRQKARDEKAAAAAAAGGDVPMVDADGASSAGDD